MKNLEKEIRIEVESSNKNVKIFAIETSELGFHY